MTKTKKTKECIEVCNELLRGEISALEVYNQALEKFAGEVEASTLRHIRDDHSVSVETLKRNVISMGGKPSLDSGAWGSFAKTIQGSAKLLGEGAVLATLSQGEKYGKEQYEQALENDSVMPECKELIKSQLLPMQRQHIDTLDRISG